MAVGDQELWACASLVLEQRGEATDAHIAERIATLATAGDWEGVATWRAIAERVDKLRDVEGVGMPRH